jgi:hypothetical protein
MKIAHCGEFTLQEAIFYFRDVAVLVFNWNTAASVTLPELALDTTDRFKAPNAN